MRTRDVVALLQPRMPRLLLAITFGVLAQCSALALTAVSAWLITRAWQMPPVLDLTVAAVTVRALAISRGIFGYCERLASHDVALRAAGSARERIYARLAGAPLDAVMRRRSGELVTRVGADVDGVSDALVRAVIPIGVAAVLGVAAVALVGVISPAAAAVLVTCLVVAGVLAPWLAARAAAAQEAVAQHHHAERDVAAMTALEHGPELLVSGRLDGLIADAERGQHEWGAAMDRAARPAAAASAMPVAAIGAAVLATTVIGIGLVGRVAPTTLAVLLLVPLAAFEATTALPNAAMTLTRARLAARRLFDLPARGASPGTASSTGGGTLEAVELRVGYASSAAAGPFTVTLPPGSRAVVTGPSGAGKTTLLMTLAGLLDPLSGEVRLGGKPLTTIAEGRLTARIGYFAEDAHLFATTVRDNLLAVRGDCTDEEIVDVLSRVGLNTWRTQLRDGLDTVLTDGAQAVSAGQRRRLLLARALVSRVDIVLLDEPTEHLDADDAQPMLDRLINVCGGLFRAEQTVVVATHQAPPDGHVKISLAIPKSCSDEPVRPA